MPRRFDSSAIMEECFLDYCCLNCDKQTSGEAYCSQRCRLADLETSTSGSEPSSPANSSTLSNAPHTSSNNGFYLPPAFDFSAYRRSPPPSASSSRPSSWFSFQDEPASPRVLSPSSSHNSLKTDALPTRAQTELRSYTNSFDPVRDWKRRMTKT